MRDNKKLITAIIVVAASSFIIAICCCVCYFVRDRRRRQQIKSLLDQENEYNSSNNQNQNGEIEKNKPDQILRQSDFENAKTEPTPEPTQRAMMTTQGGQKETYPDDTDSDNMKLQKDAEMNDVQSQLNKLKKLKKQRLKQRGGIQAGQTTDQAVSLEEVALQQFKDVLRKELNVTPEAFFRKIDLDNKLEIKVTEFKRQIKRMKLPLAKRTVNRLIAIFDEDINGYICIEEYYNTLYAYNCLGEVTQGFDEDINCLSYTTNCVYKLV